MPISSIISQPAADSLNAAYRPIVFRVSATATSGGTPPVVYCDIYVNDIYYKSQQKTQSGAGGWQFDIQDACQEVLKSFIAGNGGTNIIPANTVFTTVFCKFRSSGFDADGFITPEDTPPVQGTGSTAPTAGTGTSSNTFYVVNSTLQHDQNQDLASHLAAYKTGSWDASTWPLTHRIAGYRLSENDSDYFPIVCLGADPTCITVNYTLNDGTTGSANDCGVTTACPMVTGIDVEVSDNGDGTQTISAFWDSPDPILTTINMQYRITGVGSYTSHIVLAAAGTTSVTVPLGTYDVRLQASGACNSSLSSVHVVGVDPPECEPVDVTDLSPILDDAHVGSSYIYILPVSGTTPITKSAVTKPAWMTISEGPSTTLTGIPSSGDVGTNIPVIFTLTNACGSITINTTINVLDGVHFAETTFVSGDSLNDVEIANLEGLPDTTVHITMDTLSNTNGGIVRVNGSTAFVGNTWDVVLDGSGIGSLDVEINGIVTTPTTVIIAHFVITSVSAGAIGTPDVYQISKIFT